MSVNNYFKYKWTKCSNPENRVAEWIKKENKLHIHASIKGLTQHLKSHKKWGDKKGYSQTYKEDLIPILLKLFQNTEGEGWNPFKLVLMASITLISKSKTLWKQRK